MGITHINYVIFLGAYLNYGCKNAKHLESADLLLPRQIITTVLLKDFIN